MRTTRGRQVTEDVSESTCGRRKLDSIWTTRWRRHKSRTGRSGQLNEPLERQSPANTTKGTRYQNPREGTRCWKNFETRQRASIQFAVRFFITDHSHEDGSVNGEEHVLQSSSEQNFTTKGMFQVRRPLAQLKLVPRGFVFAMSE